MVAKTRLFKMPNATVLGGGLFKFYCKKIVEYLKNCFESVFEKVGKFFFVF